MRVTTPVSMDGTSAAKAGIHDREIRDVDTQLQKWISEEPDDLWRATSRIWRLRKTEYVAD
jgi:hypothetical protein